MATYHHHQLESHEPLEAAHPPPAVVKTAYREFDEKQINFEGPLEKLPRSSSSCANKEAVAAHTRIRQKLDDLRAEKTKCHIHIVHGHLRNENPSPYEPQILAVGLYHHGKRDTQLMEKHKLRYLNSLLQDQGVDVYPYVLAIEDIKHDALLFYPNCKEDFAPEEFANMMLLDGCFIIELLRKYKDTNLRQADDPIFESRWMLHSIKRDLMLFENQIPFAVLCKLFCLVEGQSRDLILSLLDLISNFFGGMIRGDGYRMPPASTISYLGDIKHLLHWMHIFWSHNSLASHQKSVDENLSKSFQFVDSVSKLRDVNVKFEKNDDQEASLFDITFENGTLKLSLLRIDDETDSLFRNLIAYEQYFPERKQLNFATDYMRFLDCIIDSPGDVEILCERGILDNWLDSDEAVSNMVNKLTDSVTVRDFLYAGVCDDVKKHCEKRRNKWMAKLRRNRRAILKGVAALVL